MGIFSGLTNLETYVYYDKPILFTAWCAALGKTVLVVLTDGGDGSEKWLSVTLSEARHEALKRGEIDFHDTFKQAESGACTEYTFHYDNMGLNTVAPILCEYLTDDDLPLSGESVAN